MAETFGQRFDQHTNDIITATELLKELADREGQYVWKKYGGEMLLVNPTMYVTGMFDDVTVTADFDISNLDISFFDGFRDTVGNYFSYENGSLYFVFLSNGNKALVTSWNASNGKMVINASANFGTNAPITYSGVKADYVDYVVSDEPNAYPDGGEQDGCYYELVKEEEPPEPYGIVYGDIDSSGIPRSILFNLFDFMNVDESLLSFDREAMGLPNIRKATIKCTSIATKQFQHMFHTTDNAKIKVFTNSIGSSAFRNSGMGGGKPKFFIPKQVTTISGTSTSSSGDVGPFYNSSAATIYCEHASQPSGFASRWSYGAGTVTWGVTEEQFDAL